MGEAQGPRLGKDSCRIVKGLAKEHRRELLNAFKQESDVISKKRIHRKRDMG